MILAARNRERNRRVNKVRKFQYPNALVNFDAQTIFELLDLDRLPQSYITAPPLFRNFSDKDLIRLGTYESKNGSTQCFSGHFGSFWVKALRDFDI